MSQDRVFDLVVELVEFASAHGLPRTSLALEDALDAFLQDRALVPVALPAPTAPPTTAPPMTGRSEPGPVAPRADAPPRPALVDPARPGDGAPAPAPAPARRLHLLPSQRVA